ncbi:hypothetical protein LCL97_08285 [Seohaeicola saemankumensis]|nr:hypothetical protein [Seohaeicola saemankumensis]MCA0870818.1 hypothetical protein [Seohaeicola saemankumensis]
MRIWRFAAGLAAGLLLAVPVMAEVDLAAVKTCVAQRAEAGTSTECVSLSHTECRAFPEDAPAAATLCFKQAHDRWSEGIAARMTEIRAAVEDPLAAAAGIDVKYDLLTSLLQCDRMEEMALLQEGPPETVLLQKTRCTALASGYVYVRLLLRSRNLP